MKPALHSREQMESLLSVIHDAVRSRPGPPGFEAHVCLVERSVDGDRYWHLAASKNEVAFGYRDDVPQGCTTLIVFDENQPQSVRVAGEQRHLSQLIDRYLGGSTWLALRAKK
jgi:hypothetical protein